MYYSNFNPGEEPGAILKAINELKIFEKFDDITNMLGKKLEEYFIDVPEKDNCKTISGINYYSNGLMQDAAHNRVILSPWTPTVKVEEKIINTQVDRKPLRGINEFWYYQFAFYENRRIVKRIKLAEALKVYEANLKLKEEVNIPIELGKEDCHEALMYELRDFLHHRYQGGIYLLNEKGLELIKLRYDMGKSFSRYGSYDFERILKTSEYSINLNTPETFQEYYKELYAAATGNSRETLIKLGILEEGFIPSF